MSLNYGPTILNGRFKLSEKPLLHDKYASIFDASDMLDSDRGVIVKIISKEKLYHRELNTILAIRSKNLLGLTELVDCGKVNTE